jgi:hypothetical protein
MMNTRTCTLLLLALLLTLASSISCSKSTSEPEALSIEDLLVKNNELAGWTYGDERWVARNSTELFAQINGAGDVNIRNGFQEGASQNYEGTINETAVTLTLTIFDQTTEENARTVYEDPDTGMGGAVPWVDGAGEEAHYLSTSLSATLTFYRGKYYVLLNIGSGLDEALNVLKQFALNVDGKID